MIVVFFLGGGLYWVHHKLLVTFTKFARVLVKQRSGKGGGIEVMHHMHKCERLGQHGHVLVLYMSKPL